MSDKPQLTPKKFHCENCGCEIDASFLLGYKDEPERGLCKDCRPIVLAELRPSDGDDYGDDSEDMRFNDDWD